MLRSLALLMVLMTLPAGAAAQEAALRASAWTSAPSSRLRLILPETVPQGGLAYGAVEVHLATGAKTYWRNPGETGVPTTADFAGSTGLSELVLAYPMPGPFDDGAGGIAYGYSDRVIFPVALRRDAAAQGAASLAVALEYGVCTKAMCIPAQAKLRLGLGEGEAAADLAEAIRTALARVPVNRDLGAEGHPALLTVIPSVTDGRLALSITARSEGGEPAPLLIVDAQDVFTVTQEESNKPGIVQFRAVAAGSLEAGKPLGTAALVFSAGGKAIETKVNLDEALKRP